MSFYTPVSFRAELTKVSLMDFIALTEPDCYYLVLAGGDLCYGMFLSEDMLEYLTSEFTVNNLQIVAACEV